MSYARPLAGGALAALLSTTVLAACGASEQDEAAGDGPWSFTSGDGTKVTLDLIPERIIASGAEAAALISNPKHAPELLDFQRWGLDVINPDAPDKGFPYWENLSWENADKYQPDLLLIDDRTYDATLEQGEKQPTWSSIKAANAKAYVPWPAYWTHTYGEYAEQLEQLTAAIQKADADLA